MFLSRDFFFYIIQVYFLIFPPIPLLEYKRSNDNFLSSPHPSWFAPARRAKMLKENSPCPCSVHAWNMKFPAGPIFTRVYTREAEGRAGNRSRMRGPVVNRDRRRASRATLTRQRRGCKQAESHAREFDGVLLLVFKAFCTPVRGGEGGRYGCHVAETRQACRSPSRNFISGRNAPLPPSFSPLRFRSSMRERKSFLRRFDAT